MATKLVLRHKFALGDAVLLTALCRDIQRAHPGRFDLIVDTHYREIFEHNPNARIIRGAEPDARWIDVMYRDGIVAAGKGHKVHMLSWYHRDFSAKTGFQVPVTEPRGDLHLTDLELNPVVPGRYWVVLAGGKNDATVKIWRSSRWQQTVDALRRLNILCVQAGTHNPEHIHPKLEGVVDMVGKCHSARQLFGLIANADGVICPITGAMHVAACFNRPCVVIAGGREEPHWESYTNVYNAFGPQAGPVAVPHRFLHTIGRLDCCSVKGCWKHRTVPLNNKDRWDVPARRCALPVAADGIYAPKCMDLIEVDHVIEAVMSYYTDNTIPPVGEPAGTYRNVTQPAVPAPRNVIMVDLPGFGPALEPSPAVPVPVTQPPPSSCDVPAALSNPILGGKLTICILCYGDHDDLARSCIESITSTLSRSCFDLRVGLNAGSTRTRDYLNSLADVVVYDEPGNIKKYPMMRKMFNDPAHPLTTPYVVWFDDDARVVDRTMWSQLCSTIVSNHPHGCRLFGWPMVHDLQPYTRPGNDPYAWFKSAAWWKGRPLWLRGRPAEAPNGTMIQFVPGWFFAVAVETIRSASIPDTRLNHNGGDVVIGEQVHQAGGRIKSFNANKTMVFTPPKEAGGRRGWHEPFQWC